MIDVTKTYRTRDGREVRIYAVDGRGNFPVHGAILNSSGRWDMAGWNEIGFSNSFPLSTDLILVRPRIQFTVWANVYPDTRLSTSATRNGADRSALSNRRSCIPIKIDCEEGEGIT